MKILQFSLGQLQANCYFLIEKNNCLIIDPGDEASFILQYLQRERLNLVGLLATHGHFDHIMAVGEIQESFPVPFCVNKQDLFLVKNVKEASSYFLGYQPAILPIKIIKYFNQQRQLKIKNFSFKVLFTPGHTPGSVCFYFSKDKVLFTGDTLFKQGIGRYDFSYSDKNQLQKSLQKIFKLPMETKIFPGHGESSFLEKEKDFIYQNFIV